MKNLKVILSMCALSIVFSCKTDDDQIVISPVAETPVPALTSIQPNHGPKNTLVTIKGSDFGNDENKVLVSFNDVQAVISSVTETEIKVEVPSLSLTGQVKVVIEDKELIGPEFTYEFSEAHVITLAGNKDEGGYLDGQGNDAQFTAFGGITMDSEGNIFVSQPINNTIRKITPEGAVTTFAGPNEGSLDGPISEATFSWPNNVAHDADGNMYVSDTNNNRIRKISTEGIVSTLAGSWQGYNDGQESDAEFFLPRTLTVDSFGNVYVAEGSADNSTTRIRKISPEGLVTTFAGGAIGYADGPKNEARFKYINGLAIDASDNIIVSDAGNFKIRKISTSGQVTTIAGSSEGYADGTGDEAQFRNPQGLAVDRLNNIYVADYSNMRIRKINPEGMVTTIAGSGQYGFDDGEGVNAKIAFPRTLIIDNNFNLFFTQNNLVRKISME